MALELKRGLDGLAHVRIVVHDEHAPSASVSRVHP
jgi:hypothetical protein